MLGDLYLLAPCPCCGKQTRVKEGKYASRCPKCYCMVKVVEGELVRAGEDE